MGMGMGRVPPLTLVGEGAAQFARERGVRVVDAPEEMVAPRARQEWRVWRERCRRDEGDGEVEPGSSEDLPLGVGEGLGLGGEEGSEALRVRMDTVGAVVLVGGASEIGQRPEVAAGVSRCVVSPTGPSPCLHMTLTRLTYFRWCLAGAYCSSTLDA